MTTQRRILLVDDDRKLAGAMKRLLELRGYMVQLAFDAPRARAELSLPEMPDVILMDINMPGVDGVELCREIRAMSDMPIIFVTGLEKTDELLESGFDAGGDDYMTKPVNINELSLRVEALLRRAEKAAKSALGARSTPHSGITPSGIDEEKFARLTANLDERERQITRLVALGKDNQEIAEILGYAVGSVRNITSQIYAKTGTANRAELKKRLSMKE